MGTVLEDPSGTDRGPVSLERDLSMSDGGVFATYRLSTTLNRRVECRVVDPLPSYWARIQLIGVHPSFEPIESTVSPTRIEFSAAVPSASRTVVKFGIRPHGGVDPSDITEGRQTHTPRIETLEPAPGDGRLDDERETAEGRRRELPPALRSREAFVEAKRELFGRDRGDGDARSVGTTGTAG